MELNQRRRLVAVTSAIWILILSACAFNVKTWFVSEENVSESCKSERVLIRKASDGTIKEALNVVQAHGYLCYSASDDALMREKCLTWQQCCDQKEAGALQ